MTKDIVKMFFRISKIYKKMEGCNDETKDNPITYVGLMPGF